MVRNSGLLADDAQMAFPLARSAVVEVDEIDVAYFASLDLAVDDHESLAGTDQSCLQM